MQLLFVLLLQISQAFAQPEIISTFPATIHQAVSSQWPLIVRFNAPVNPGEYSISLAGSETGKIPFNLKVSADKQVINILPGKSYKNGEQITLRISGKNVAEKVIRFSGKENSQSLQLPTMTRREKSVQENAIIESNAASIKMINGVSVPSDFPGMVINQMGETDSGYIFTNNWSTVGETPYLIIMENDGTPIYYRRMNEYSRDFKVQRPDLLSYFEPWAFYTMDSNYQDLKRYEPGNGASTDEHEFLVRPDNRVLMIAKYHHIVDMSQVVTGGRTNATVLENYIVELDDTGVTTFIWRSEDHFTMTDTYEISLTSDYIDYVHMNSISFDDDGHLIISSRHLNEISKIHYPSGEFIWRLGGRKNQFSFTNDVDKFNYQHYAQRTASNRYILFDNGTLKNPPNSRAVEYQLDTVANTAMKVWYYRHNPVLNSWFMGSAQRLPNGNTFISWAVDVIPKITEVTPAGTVVYQMDFSTPAHNYRSFRMPWKGQSIRPYLLGELNAGGSTLIFNLFGKRKVKTYRIYYGQNEHSLSLLDSTSNPFYQITELPPNQYFYFETEGVWEDGSVSKRSNRIRLAIKSSKPGENMLFNSGFDTDTYPWFLDTYDGAAAELLHVNGEAMIQIGTGGPNVWSVEFKQRDLALAAGHTYRFEFDAWSNVRRTIEPIISKAADPWTNYSKIGNIALTTSKKRYSYKFTVGSFSEPNARIVFACGTSSADVFLDNISLIDITGVGVEDENPTSAFRILNIYPNPFNPSTRVKYITKTGNPVSFEVLDLLGRIIYRSEESVPFIGENEKIIDGSGWASGMYMLRMHSEGQSVTNPLVLIK